MSTRIVFVTLFSAAILSSCSSPSEIRPEVAQPLNEARLLANGWTTDKVAIMAKLNQAASVPNLNSDERRQIRATGEYALARAPHGDQTAGVRSGPPARGADYYSTMYGPGAGSSGRF